MLTFGSLFSGIGGIDLGLERAGMRCMWQCEIDDYATKVLEKHWPNTPRFRDVRTVGRDTLARVDLIAGGFPCQPHSLAGRRQASQDERDLWPEFARLIRELRPRWVLAENVLGLLSSEGGTFFGQVLRDLAEAGYDAEWAVLRASDVGAPHQRERVFVVAHSSSTRWEKQQETGRAYNQLNASNFVENTNRLGDTSQKSNKPCWLSRTAEPAGICTWQDNTPGVGLADAHSTRLQEWDRSTAAPWSCSKFNRHPTGQSESILGRSPDGLSNWLDRYRWPSGPKEDQRNWEPARIVTERQKNRAARLKALGNAVVPQIAEYIGLCILAYDEARE